MTIKDVHTEHCCATHGCKYSYSGADCTVMAGAPQSFPCEECEEEGYWIKKYPDTEGKFWITLNWGKTSTVELATAKRTKSGLVVYSMGSFLSLNDILATWSKPVIIPEMYVDRSSKEQ